MTIGIAPDRLREALEVILLRHKADIKELKVRLTYEMVYRILVRTNARIEGAPPNTNWHDQLREAALMEHALPNERTYARKVINEYWRLSHARSGKAA